MALCDVGVIGEVKGGGDDKVVAGWSMEEEPLKEEEEEAVRALMARLAEWRS